MSTFGDLVNQVSNMLHAFCGVQERVTWLTAGCDADDTTLTVADSTAIAKGIAEIDDELLYVAASDSGSLTIAPFGRGFRGTTAASHSNNAKVTSAPLFPQSDIKRAINQALQSIYPDLYQIKTTEFTFAGYQATYELPADVEKVLRVSYEATGPTLYWPTLRYFEFEPKSDVATGRALTLLEAPEQGRTVRVVYAAKFVALSSPGDDVTTVSGLPSSAEDVLLYGAASQLLRFMDISRIVLGSVENVARAQVVSADASSKLANQLYAMHRQRVDEERRKLLDQIPPIVNYQR